MNNLLKPTSFFTYRQAFNAQNFYMLPTLYLCVLYVSHNKQRLSPYTTLADWFCITEFESVYCAVRTEPLYKTDTVS